MPRTSLDLASFLTLTIARSCGRPQLEAVLLSFSPSDCGLRDCLIACLCASWHLHSDLLGEGRAHRHHQCQAEVLADLQDPSEPWNRHSIDLIDGLLADRRHPSCNQSLTSKQKLLPTLQVLIWALWMANRLRFSFSL